jgi:hypothetical protein
MSQKRSESVRWTGKETSQSVNKRGQFDRKQVGQPVRQGREEANLKIRKSAEG